MTAPAELVAALRWRYATKKFDPARTIPAPTWEALVDSLILTPSSYGLQPWRFVIVDDPAVKRTLRAVSWNQAQVEECQHHVVFLARDAHTEADADRLVAATAHARGSSVDSLARFRAMLVKHGAGHTPERILAWATNQVYIALGQFMLACAQLRVDACPMEGIDHVAYDRILDLQDSGFRTIVACSVGYRMPDDTYASLPKVRYDRAHLVRVV